MSITALEKNKCCGCMACANVCPTDCIFFRTDEEGFLYPHVDEAQCISCGLCEKACPILTPRKSPAYPLDTVFAAIAKDSAVHAASTSGGAFTELCRAYCTGDYAIYGCELCEDMTVRHARITDFAELPRFTRSKYVQSDMGQTYRQVKADLKSGRRVLFSGTPCQVAALKNALGKEYDNLLTVDFVCHGVPNQAAFTSYLHSLERRRHQKITRFEFRNKTYQTDHWDFIGSKVYWEDGTTSETPRSRELYMNAFLSGWLMRPSCGDCRFANLNRPSDVTLGDFHGISDFDPSWDAGKTSGTSLLMCNTDKALTLVEQLGQTMDLLSVPLDVAVAANLYLSRSVARPAESGALLRELQTGDFIRGVKRRLPQFQLWHRIKGKLMRTFLRRDGK